MRSPMVIISRGFRQQQIGNIESFEGGESRSARGVGGLNIDIVLPQRTHNLISAITHQADHRRQVETPESVN